MGNCRFCGQPAGFLRHQHKECRQRHDEAAEKIAGFFVKALQDPVPGDQFRKLVDQGAAQNFIGDEERDRLIRQGLSTAIHTALKDGALATTDDRATRRVAGCLRPHSRRPRRWRPGTCEGANFARARRRREAADPIEFNGPLAPRLESGERPLWLFNGVAYLMVRSRTRYVGGSSGVSIRVMRGVYYRAGGFRGEPVKTDYLSNEDTGSLTIADQNVYFVGTHRALKIPLKKIASTQLYTDGIEILQNGVSAKPVIFKLDDPPFAANLLSRL